MIQRNGYSDLTVLAISLDIRFLALCQVVLLAIKSIGEKVIL